MQNTAVQSTGQAIAKLSSSSKKSTAASDMTSSVSAENTDPYLQIFLSLLSQTQQGGDAKSQSSSDTESETVGQISAQQSILNMLGLAGEQNAAVLTSTENAQTATDLTSLAGSQSKTDAQSTESTQNISDLLRSMNIQSVDDLLSALNVQSTSTSQSSEDLQAAADLRSAVNSLRAAILQSSADTLSASASQSAAGSKSTEGSQSMASSQSTISLKGLESSEVTQTSTDVNSLSAPINSQNSDGTLAAAAEQTGKTVTDSSNQAVTDTEANLNTKLETLPRASEFSESANSDNKTEVQTSGTSAAENSEKTDISAAKDGSENIQKSTDSSSASDTDKKSGEKELDLSKLQGEMTPSKEISTSGTEIKTVEKTAEPKVSEQIASDISKNLDLGKSEFTVKLKPESLGEITLKLSEVDGKTTLSITTASANTAKLINDDLTNLKAAVSQMNVQVNEAVAKSSDTQQSAMQQFSMAGQQSSGQQYTGGQAYSSSAYSAANDSNSTYAEQDTINTQSISAPTKSSGSIDTYI
jgi:trimeric autotransporter adhesin